MDSLKAKSSANFLKNFGSDLVEFYHKVISKEFDFRNPANSKMFEHDIKHFSRTDTVFSTASRRCAYVFQHSPLISSLAAYHLLELFKLDLNKTDQLLNQEELKICCLGGGPGTDAVAVSKIVTTVHQVSTLHNKQKLKLQFTIIDNEENWKITAENVMEMLKQTLKFFDAKKMKLSFQFLKADLIEPLTSDVLFEICQADILTMFYLISSVQEKATLSAKQNMIQSIFSNMKTGALLLFIDVPVFPCYNLMRAAAKKCKNLCQVYGPYEHKLHLLSLDAVKRNFQLYSKDLGSTLCVFSCVSTISAWCKETEVVQNLTSVTEEVSDLQEMGSEAHTEENRTERIPNQKAVGKREGTANNMKINTEGKTATQPTMSETEKSIRLNAANIKAFTSEVEKIRKQFYKNTSFGSRGKNQKNKRMSNK